MSKIEKEIKVLNIEIEPIKRRLSELGATLISDGIQKIFVYDLPSIYSRFYDCIEQLNNCSRTYDIEICKNKLENLFFEIDNLTTNEQKKIIFDAIGHKTLKETLLTDDISILKNIFSKPVVVKIIKELGVNPNKWIRLRETDGKTTITVKHILDDEWKNEYKTKTEPVLETEMEVPSIKSGNMILKQLGFAYRNYQEKKRTTYTLNNTEIDIDIWPIIPPYMEIEGESDKQINEIINKLQLSEKTIVSCNTSEVYKKYGIDIYQYRELKFN